MQYIELYSERLHFRKFRQSDFPIVYDWLSSLENMKYRSSEPKNEQESHAYLDWAIKCAEEDPCVNFRYAVELKDTGELILRTKILRDWLGNFIATIGDKDTELK